MESFTLTHSTKVLYFEAVHALNEIESANNPHGVSTYFGRIEKYAEVPEFHAITSVDEMMGYLANL